MRKCIVLESKEIVVGVITEWDISTMDGFRGRIR